ncbi:hypothetical protein Droror1_Dr00017726, partial [Drosera rotundifolia]
LGRRRAVRVFVGGIVRREGSDGVVIELGAAGGFRCVDSGVGLCELVKWRRLSCCQALYEKGISSRQRIQGAIVEVRDGVPGVLGECCCGLGEGVCVVATFMVVSGLGIQGDDRGVLFSGKFGLFGDWLGCCFG